MMKHMRPSGDEPGQVPQKTTTAEQQAWLKWQVFKQHPLPLEQS